MCHLNLQAYAAGGIVEARHGRHPQNRGAPTFLAVDLTRWTKGTSRQMRSTRFFQLLPRTLSRTEMSPRSQQLERDHPRMARLFNRGLLPFGIWEQLLEAESMMDAEVHEVQAEAEKLQKGWGQGVFGQAYQMLRKERDEEQREAQFRREAAELSLEFTQLSGGVVKIIADARNVSQQTQMVLRKDFHNEEVAFKSEVRHCVRQPICTQFACVASSGHVFGD